MAKTPFSDLFPTEKTQVEDREKEVVGDTGFEPVTSSV